jgi:hypothetical protein
LVQVAVIVAEPVVAAPEAYVPKLSPVVVIVQDEAMLAETVNTAVEVVAWASAIDAW